MFLMEISPDQNWKTTKSVTDHGSFHSIGHYLIILKKCHTEIPVAFFISPNRPIPLKIYIQFHNYGLLENKLYGKGVYQNNIDNFIS